MSKTLKKTSKTEYDIEDFENFAKLSLNSTQLNLNSN